MNRVSRKYEHVSLLKSVSLSIHFHFLWFRQVYWRDLQSDQISRQHQNIHCIILFLLSLLWCAVQCIGWPPWSPGFISRLLCTGGDRTTFSQCCVIHKRQWPESRSMKKSPEPRTHWTLMVTQPWIWSDLIRSEVEQHNKHRDAKCCTWCLRWKFFLFLCFFLSSWTYVVWRFDVSVEPWWLSFIVSICIF